MAVLAVGGEADCWEPVSGQDYAYDTTSGHYESTVTRGAMKVTSAASEIELITSQALAEGYIHMYLYQEAVAGDVDDWIQIKKANGDPAFRISLNSDGSWSVQKYKSAAWSADLASSAGSVLANDAAAFDIYIKVDGSAGEIRVYKETVEIITFTGDTSIDNLTFGRIHFKGQTGGANELSVSQVILADESTLGWKLASLNPTGNGANTQWTGDYTDVDEFIFDDTDFIEALTTGLIETSTMSDLSALLGSFNVKAVAFATRAENDSGSSINDIQAALRISGTNYFSADLGLPKDGADHSVQAIFATNPATSGSWSQSVVNALEAGLKSV
jgi:hypothetical protein